MCYEQYTHHVKVVTAVMCIQDYIISISLNGLSISEPNPALTGSQVLLVVDSTYIQFHCFGELLNNIL